MREDLLQFIWKNHYYNHRELQTEAGDRLFILYPGDANTDQGPDFANARITIGDAIRVGAIELHVKATDFNRHGHTGDPHYKNVILHVVWINDSAAPPAGIPVLALSGRVPTTLIPRYRQFMAARSAATSFVPCASLLSAATEASKCWLSFRHLHGPPFADQHWPPFRDRLLRQRLANRTIFIRSLIDEKNPDWEEVAFQLMARSLGQPVNTDSFLTIARGLRLKDLLRRSDDPGRLDTMIRDQAERLPHPLLCHRMRPANSPYVRLRQLAELSSNHTGRFTLLLESADPGPLLKTLQTKGLGPAMRYSILINAFIPLLYAYASLRQELSQSHKTFLWLQALPPENNHIIRGWRDMGIRARSAADTQALLELRKSYCREKRCLQCEIGRRLLTAPPMP